MSKKRRSEKTGEKRNKGESNTCMLAFTRILEGRPRGGGEMFKEHKY